MGFRVVGGPKTLSINPTPFTNRAPGLGGSTCFKELAWNLSMVKPRSSNTPPLEKQEHQQEERDKLERPRGEQKTMQETIGDHCERGTGKLQEDLVHDSFLESVILE